MAFNADIKQEILNLQNSIDTGANIARFSETEEGRYLLKNVISPSLIARYIDNTGFEKVPSTKDYFKSNFTDIVRPNKLHTRIAIGNEVLKMSNLVKSVTLPSDVRNVIQFKRAGKTIKLPLNKDSNDNISLSFFQDIDNNVLAGIFRLLTNIDTILIISFVYSLHCIGIVIDT